MVLLTILKRVSFNTHSKSQSNNFKLIEYFVGIARNSTAVPSKMRFGYVTDKPPSNLQFLSWEHVTTLSFGKQIALSLEPLCKILGYFKILNDRSYLLTLSNQVEFIGYRTFKNVHKVCNWGS